MKKKLNLHNEKKISFHQNITVFMGPKLRETPLTVEKERKWENEKI